MSFYLLFSLLKFACHISYGRECIEYLNKNLFQNLFQNHFWFFIINPVSRATEVYVLTAHTLIDIHVNVVTNFSLLTHAFLHCTCFVSYQSKNPTFWYHLQTLPFDLRLCHSVRVFFAKSSPCDCALFKALWNENEISPRMKETHLVADSLLTMYVSGSGNTSKKPSNSLGMWLYDLRGTG